MSEQPKVGSEVKNIGIQNEIGSEETRIIVEQLKLEFNEKLELNRQEAEKLREELLEHQKLEMQRTDEQKEEHQKYEDEKADWNDKMKVMNARLQTVDLILLEKEDLEHRLGTVENALQEKV